MTAWTPAALSLGCITPETLGDAIAACKGDQSALAIVVGEALWAMSDRLAEDANLCAFVLARAIGDRPAAGVEACRRKDAETRAWLASRKDGGR